MGSPHHFVLIGRVFCLDVDLYINRAKDCLEKNHLLQNLRLSGNLVDVAEH